MLPALDYRIVSEAKPWVSRDNRVVINMNVSNEESSKQDSEFIVVVHSDTEAYFSIIYSTKDSCDLNTLGHPIRLKLAANESRCLSFSINRIDDLNILLGSAGFELELNQLKI